MGLFENKYPYTNYHEINLDEFIRKVVKVEENIPNFKRVDEKVDNLIERIDKLVLPVTSAAIQTRLTALNRKVLSMTGSMDLADRFRRSNAVRINSIGDKHLYLRVQDTSIDVNLNFQNCGSNISSGGRIYKIGGAVLSSNCLTRILPEYVSESGYDFTVLVNGRVRYESGQDSGEMENFFSEDEIFSSIAIVINLVNHKVVQLIDKSGIKIYRSYVTTIPPTLTYSGGGWEKVIDTDHVCIAYSTSKDEDGHMICLENEINSAGSISTIHM